MIVLIIFLFCVILFGICLLIMGISELFSKVTTLAREQKKITKAFDKAFFRKPQKQKRHLHKAEWRYREYLRNRLNRENRKLLRKAKWVI